MALGGRGTPAMVIRNSDEDGAGRRGEAACAVEWEDRAGPWTPHGRNMNSGLESSVSPCPNESPRRGAGAFREGGESDHGALRKGGANRRHRKQRASLDFLVRSTLSP